MSVPERFRSVSGPAAFPLPPGLCAAAREAMLQEQRLARLAALGYSEAMARGMILGAGLTTQTTYEMPSHAIDRMMSSAAWAAELERRG